MESSRHRSIFKYHPRWGYQFRPRLYVRVAHFEPHNQRDRSSYVITSNARGGRTSHEPRPSPDGAVDLLWLGCSFTAGDGVSNQRRFSDLVEAGLAGLRCHNWALSGAGNDQQYLIHREIAPELNPQVLVVSPYVGCLGRDLVPGRESFDPFCRRRVYRPKPYFTLEGGELVLHNSPVPRVRFLDRPLGEESRRRSPACLGRRVLGRLRRLASGPEPDLGELVHYRRRGGTAYRLTRAILGKTLAQSRARYKILAPLPHHPYFLGERPPDYLELFQEVARAGGARLWDVLPVFMAQEPEKREELILSHNHYSEKAHRLLADFFITRLQELLNLEQP